MPTPVSRHAHARRASPSSTHADRRSRRPTGVNFIAFDSRLSRICCRRSRSTYAVLASHDTVLVLEPLLAAAAADERLELRQRFVTTPVAQLETHSTGLELREIEDVVDQDEQVMLVALDALEIRALRLGDRPADPGSAARRSRRSR